MGYVEKGDRMTDNYLINQRTWKWASKLFFHRLDITILNNIILSFEVEK